MTERLVIEKFGPIKKADIDLRELSTHSPYVLYAINNFLMVQKVLDAGKPLPENISPKVALRPEQVAAYRFGDDGRTFDIMDRQVGLIDESELDDVADMLGSDFSALQDSLDSTLLWSTPTPPPPDGDDRPKPIKPHIAQAGRAPRHKTLVILVCERIQPGDSQRNGQP